MRLIYQSQKPNFYQFQKEFHQNNLCVYDFINTLFDNICPHKQVRNQ